MKNIMSLASFNLIILTMCSVVSTCFAKDHKIQWALDVDYSVLANKKIEAGDNLVFEYDSNAHTVSQVSEEDYKSCKTSNVYSEDQSGRTVIPVNTASTRYFICTVPGHCRRGMKLAVTAVDSDQSGTPPPPAEDTPSQSSPSTRSYGSPPASPGPDNKDPNYVMVYSSSAIISPLAALTMATLIAPFLIL